MEAIVNWLKETHQKNWVLFCVVLSVVNVLAFWHITDKWFVFSLKSNNIAYDPFFLGLEILLTSLAVTRILVAMDIIYLLQIWPITGDLVILVDRRKRVTRGALIQDKVTSDMIEHVDNLCTKHSLEQSVDFDKELIPLLQATHHAGQLIFCMEHKDCVTNTVQREYFVQFHISHYGLSQSQKYRTLYTTTYFVFWSIVALVCCYFIGMVFGNEITTFFYASLIILYAHNNCPN